MEEEGALGAGLGDAGGEFGQVGDAVVYALLVRVVLAYPQPL